MDQQVAEYLAKAEPWQQDVAARLQEVIATAIPDREEVFRYGKPHYLKNGEYAALIMASKGKVSFMLFNASEIEPIKGYIRSMGNGERKTVDIVEGQEVDYDQLTSWLTQTSATL